jgi:hypothetical protein
LHNPIGLDLRTYSRQFSIHKNGITPDIFVDFTKPVNKAPISSTKLEKICRSGIIGYVIQVDFVSHPPNVQEATIQHSTISSVPHEFEDVFNEQAVLPPKRDCDHETTLHIESTPPNLRPYRVPHKQKDEVEKLIQTMLQDNIIRPSKSPYSSPAFWSGKRMDHGDCALIIEN